MFLLFQYGGDCDRIVLEACAQYVQELCRAGTSRVLQHNKVPQDHTRLHDSGYPFFNYPALSILNTCKGLEKLIIVDNKRLNEFCQEQSLA